MSYLYKIKIVQALICLIFALPLMAQVRTEPFPDDQAAFIKEFDLFFTSSKTEVTDNLMDDFIKATKKGGFDEVELAKIRQMCNVMLAQKLSPNPYFKSYIEALLNIKRLPQHGSNFKYWNEILEKMLTDVVNRKFNDYLDFLIFSKDFFAENALRKSPGGHTWRTGKDRYKLNYENKIISIEFEDLDLICTRKTDSIEIKNTKGILLPLSDSWKGAGGKVMWSRFDMKDAFVQLDTYNIQLKKNQYDASNATLTYPILFGSRTVKGNFQDKLVVENKVTEGSYPRFESYDKVLEINELGGGVKYTGGFRLEGTSVYGYGDKESKARLEISNEAGKLVYFGTSNLFIIRKGDRVTSDQVRSVVYFSDDSLSHSSTNFRYNIKTRELGLERTNRGSDKSLFKDTYHNIVVDVEKIKWYLDKDSIIFGEKSLAIAKGREEASFESDKYYDETLYRKLQNVSTINPISNLKRAMASNGTSMEIETFAKAIDPKFSPDNVQTLLYELIAAGFVEYDVERSLVELKPKVNHFADASVKKVDFDALRLISKTSNNNAEFSLRSGNIYLHAVDKIEFSKLRRVAAKPLNEEVTMKKGRNMDFKGKVFAGFGSMIGTGFHFDYNKWQIQLDSIKYLDLYVPSGEKDKNGQALANAMSSRIEQAFGVLSIDAPSNKSGVQKVAGFPSIQSKGLSYVFYDKLDIFDGIYKRDSFFFELDKFSIQGLNDYTSDDLRFKGRFHSTGVFPMFSETIIVMEDKSFGFTSKTPEDGYPAYGGKGAFKGDVVLSNKGLIGKGNLKYIRSGFDSDDLLFFPRKASASAQLFTISEGKEGKAIFPEVVGKDVKVDWNPYQDTMFIRSKNNAFSLFREAVHTLKGLIIMTPNGLKASGTLNWEKGLADSKNFDFGAFSASADTMDLKIRAVGSEDLAFDTRNIQGNLDFESQRGNFIANSTEISTTMPYNKYRTSMNEFEWDMKNETITFRSDPEKPALFQCFAPEQDSLKFRGVSAFYDLKTNLLKIGGVKQIASCDAMIYPIDTASIEITKGGQMGTLKNARIVADTSSKFHVIEDATVNVKGKKLYEAKGYYTYNVPQHDQKVYLNSIIGQRVGKGKASEKATLTSGEATIKDSANFYLGEKIRFQGTFQMKGNTPNINFKGFVALESPIFKAKSWFSIDNPVNREKVFLPFGAAKNIEGDPVRCGMFLSKSTGQVYPRIMMPTYLRKDRAVLDIKGFMKYETGKDQFVFGDSIKVFGAGLRGNKFVFNSYDGKVEGEGKLGIGSDLKFIKTTCAGRIETEFATIDTTKAIDQIKLPVVKVEAMMGVEMIVPEVLLNITINDLRSSTFETNFVDYGQGLFYDKALSEFIPDDAVLQPILSAMKVRTLELPKEMTKFTFLFSKLSMKWDPEYESFITTKEVNGLAAINGQMINKMVNCSVEARMPSTDDDDRLYIYIKAPNENFYFFGYAQGILSVCSNNTEFTDASLKLKTKDLIKKMPDDEVYEIQAVSAATASLFMERVKSSGQPVKE